MNIPNGINIKILFSFLFLPLALFAQNETDTLKFKTDFNPYFEKKDTLLNLKLAIYNLDERFEIAGSGFHYKIKPNFTLKTKFYFNYRFLSLAIAFAPKFIPGNGDDEIKGETKSFNIDLNLITKHWVQNLQFNKTKGFYLANTSDELPDWVEGSDPYIQFPDLKVLDFRGATSYKFNPDFSLKAVRTQTEIQTKSAGSFMPSLVYSYYLINNESGNIDQTSSQRSDNFEALAAIWYMHTFVIKKRWYFSFGLAPAFGFGHTKLNTRIESDHFISYYNEPIIRLNEQLGIGYNAKRFFAGFVLIASQSRQSQGGNPIIQNNMLTTFQVFAGYHFNSPKFMRKSANWIEGLVQGKDKK